MALAEAYVDLLLGLRRLPRARGFLLVGIDGKAGSGKSIVAEGLALRALDASVLNLDDFWLPTGLRHTPESAPSAPVGADLDWQRFRTQAMDPLLRGEAGRYQRYDWAHDELLEWHAIRPEGIVIVDGTYALNRDLRDLYDFRIWVSCPRDLRLSRGMMRDGDVARPVWERDWMPKEDRYVREQAPHRAADLVVDGRGVLGHQPRNFYLPTEAGAEW